MEPNKQSILNMAAGAISERADYEVGKIIGNILDPNTSATKKRKLTLEVTFTPDDERRHIGVTVTAKSKLEPTSPVATSLYMTAAPGTGEMVAVEMVPQIPGQQAMDGGEQAAPSVLRVLDKFGEEAS